MPCGPKAVPTGAGFASPAFKIERFDGLFLLVLPYFILFLLVKVQLNRRFFRRISKTRTLIFLFFVHLGNFPRHNRGTSVRDFHYIAQRHFNLRYFGSSTPILLLKYLHFFAKIKELAVPGCRQNRSLSSIANNIPRIVCHLPYSPTHIPDKSFLPLFASFAVFNLDSFSLRDKHRQKFYLPFP